MAAGSWAVSSGNWVVPRPDIQFGFGVGPGHRADQQIVAEHQVENFAGGIAAVILEGDIGQRREMELLHAVEKRKHFGERLQPGRVRVDQGFGSIGESLGSGEAGSRAGGIVIEAAGGAAEKLPAVGLDPGCAAGGGLVGAVFHRGDSELDQPAGGGRLDGDAGHTLPRFGLGRGNGDALDVGVAESARRGGTGIPEEQRQSGGQEEHQSSIPRSWILELS